MGLSGRPLAEGDLTPHGTHRAGTAPTFAIAGIEDHPVGVPLQVGLQYVLRAGVVSEQPVTGAMQFGQMTEGSLSPPADGTPLEFEITVHAPGMKVSPSHHQTFRFEPQHEQELLRFELTPEETGRKRISVEFYHEKKWLQMIVLEVDVEDQHQLP